MRLPRAGLLPLHLKLYDDTLPAMRARLEPWIDEIAAGIAAEGVALVRAPTCRLAAEFEEAVRRFEREDVDIIVTVHLAYSLSLEAIEALTAARRPLLLLDTTMDAAFGPGVDPERILYNHGIHGVQDLACMLRRRGVPFEIVAGHARGSKVLRRTAEIARAARAARCVRGARILRIGEPFRGMGDFAVGEEILERAFDFSVEHASPEALVPSIRSVSDAELETEMREDRERYDVEAPPDVHERSVRMGLGLRKFLEHWRCDALTVNFLAFDSPLDTVPFLEISKAMARGLGYAGEGDVLTAGLVGALSRGFGRTTFTEAFCPDWEGGSLFLSHMGEINPAVAAEKPRLVEKDFPWTGARNPAIIACAPENGPAVLVNLAPGPNDTFVLLVCPVEVLGDATHPAMLKDVRGWVKPPIRLEDFLERYSRAGGTHHSALVLGDHAEAIAAFGRFAGLKPTVIGAAGSRSGSAE
jgi:L-arabinose isomerase